jgi:hypothetical protein
MFHMVPSVPTVHRCEPLPSTFRTRSTWMAASGSNFLAFSIAASCVGSTARGFSTPPRRNGVTVIVLFDKEVFVVLAHNCFRVAFDMIQDALRTKWKFVVEFEDEETNEISGTIGQPTLGKNARDFLSTRTPAIRRRAKTLLDRHSRCYLCTQSRIPA